MVITLKFQTLFFYKQRGLQFFYIFFSIFFYKLFTFCINNNHYQLLVYNLKYNREDNLWIQYQNYRLTFYQQDGASIFLIFFYFHFFIINFLLFALSFSLFPLTIIITQLLVYHLIVLFILFFFEREPKFKSHFLTYDFRIILKRKRKI